MSRVAHFRWCREIATTNRAELAGPGEAAALARLETELGNLRAGLAWSLAEGNDPTGGAELALALGRFWYLRGHLDEAVRWLEPAIAAAPDLRGPLSAALGVVHQAQGLLVEATAAYEQALAVANRDRRPPAHGAEPSRPWARRCRPGRPWVRPRHLGRRPHRSPHRG